MAGLTEPQGFDVEVAVEAFFADPARTSLVLPHMTTGQRKHAKKVVERYPELTCESYGFGPDRQLNLFKKGAASPEADGRSTEQAAAAFVSVKNTFIDDWIARGAVDGGASEPVVFRSMPPQLQHGNRQSVVAERADLGNEDCQKDLLDEPHWVNELIGSCTEDCSTAASSSSSVGSSVDRLPLGLPVPPGLEIRNTFIHFQDSARKADFDERIVQSMPDQTFRQSLLQELLSDLHGRAAGGAVFGGVSEPDEQQLAAAGPAPASPVGSLLPGTEVTIDGLLKCPAFNGVAGTVQSLDVDTSRYTILLAVPAAGHKTAKVKRENLRVMAPSMPCFVPGASAHVVSPARTTRTAFESGYLNL